MFFQHVYYTQIINVKGFNGSKYLTTLWPINFFNTFFLRLLYSNNLCQGYYISVSSFCARIVHCHLKNNSTLFGFWELLFFLVYIWFCCFFLGVVFGMRCFWYALFFLYDLALFFGGVVFLNIHMKSDFLITRENKITTKIIILI